MSFDPHDVRPKTRDDGLVVERVGDELLIYDLERDKAHCLNETAALVFDHCDGEHSVAELAELLSYEAGQPIDEEVVHAALVKLRDAHLLDEPVSSPTNGKWSRRQVLRKIGVAGAAGLAFPVVTSIVAPTPAAAQASPTPCGTFPNCDGPCPTGQECRTIDSSCLCAPPVPCGGTPGNCTGACPPGQICFDTGSECQCRVTCGTPGNCTGACPPTQICSTIDSTCICTDIP